MVLEGTLTTIIICSDITLAERMLIITNPASIMVIFEAILSKSGLILE